MTDSFLAAARHAGWLSEAEAAALTAAGLNGPQALLRFLLIQGRAELAALGRAFGDTLDLAYLDLETTLFKPEVVQLLPREFCESNRLIPVFAFGSPVTVALAAPQDDAVLAEAARLCGCELVPNFAFSGQILHAIAKQASPALAPGLTSLSLSRANRLALESALAAGQGLLLLAGDAPAAGQSSRCLAATYSQEAGRIESAAELSAAATAAHSGQLVFAVLAQDTVAEALAWLQAKAEPSARAACLGLLGCARRPRLCPHCRQLYPAGTDDLAPHFCGGLTQSVELGRPAGCPQCRSTGIAGELLLHEFWSPPPEWFWTNATSPMPDTRPRLRNGSLRYDGLKKALLQELALAETLSLPESDTDQPAVSPPTAAEPATDTAAAARRARLQAKLGLAKKLQTARDAGEAPVPPPGEKPAEVGPSQYSPQMYAEAGEECRDRLNEIEPDLLALERAGGAVEPELINRVFRAIHSIKGAGKFLGCDNLNQLSHVMESLLAQFRDRQRQPAPASLDLLLRGVDRLREMTADFARAQQVDCRAETAALTSLLQSAAAVAPAGPTPPPAPAASAQLPANETLRVDLQVIEKLVSLAGELIVERTQLRRAVEPHGARHPELPPLLRNLDRVAGELEATAMRARMRPLTEVFARFPRLVRDLARKLDKEAEFLVEVGDVVLDKNIAEALTEPLTHILRNSLDHGLESPADRRRAGKPGAGTIRVRARSEGGQALIEISDDGRGIDPARVAAAAVAKGLLDQASAARLSAREQQALIFSPGFSTAAVVTDLSGRGVGLDVVKNEIERHGGQIELTSQPGSGTTVRLRLPLTRAILPALLLRVADRYFALPRSEVMELVRVRPREISEALDRLGSTPVLRRRNRLIPRADLREILGLPPGAPGDLHLAVLRHGTERFALAVDEVLGHELLAIQSLPPPAAAGRLFHGAAVLADGALALLLEASGLAAAARLDFDAIDKAQQSRERETLRLRRKDEAAGDPALLFAYGPGDQLAVPIAQISRLERRKGAAQTADAAEAAFLRLERHLPLAPLPSDLEELYLIHPRREAAPILGASAVLDIVRCPPPPVSADTPGLSGKVMIAGRPVRLLDLNQLPPASPGAAPAGAEGGA